MDMFSRPLGRGFASVVLVLVASLWVSTALSPAMLTGWATLFLVAMVPAQVVISLFWGCAYPKRIAALPQPLNGLAYLLLTVAVGVLTGLLALHTVGGGLTPPTPFVNMFLILAVTTTVTLVIVMQGWPFSLVCKTPGSLGVTLWLAGYALAWVLFRGLFDFSFMQGAPFYQARLDPHGMLMAWYPLVASLDALAFILTLALFDFWPVATLARFMPILGKQPFFGLANAVLIAALGAGLWTGFLHFGGMDIVVFMTRVCVSMVFGVFILLVMLQGVPMLKIAQPWRGLVLTACAVLLAVLMFALYHFIAERAFHLPEGQPPLELWLASSMLAITFPAMVVFANYLQFWPLPAAKQQ